MITPRLFYIEAALFLGCLTIHILLWRWGRPQHQAWTLLIIFLAPLAVPLAGIFLSPQRDTGVEMAALALLHIALTSAYLQTYPAFQAMSPTLLILLLVGQRSPYGLSQHEILSQFRDRELLHDRIDDLLAAHLVREASGALELTTQGQTLIFSIGGLRRILGLPVGRG